MRSLVPSCVLSLVAALLATSCVVDGFQFMSKWKMPVHDPHEDAVKDKFGDKSKLSFKSFFSRFFLSLISACCICMFFRRRRRRRRRQRKDLLTSHAEAVRPPYLPLLSPLPRANAAADATSTAQPTVAILCCNFLPRRVLLVVPSLQNSSS